MKSYNFFYFTVFFFSGVFVKTFSWHSCLCKGNSGSIDGARVILKAQVLVFVSFNRLKSERKQLKSGLVCKGMMINIIIMRRKFFIFYFLFFIFCLSRLTFCLVFRTTLWCIRIHHSRSIIIKKRLIYF